MPKISTKALTDTRCQKAKIARAKDGTPKTSYLWDSSIHGFGLRVTEHGTKTFAMKFIAPNGEQAWMSLGSYDERDEGKSLEDARRRASEYRRMLSAGMDPRNEVKKRHEVPTFEAFVKKHLETQKGLLRPAYFHAVKVFLEEIACPRLGSIRLNEIERFQVGDLLEEVAAGRRPWMKAKEKPEKKTPIVANRLQAALSKLFTEAERKGYRPQGTNPCKLVLKQRESRGRERYLTVLELTWLGKVLRDAPRWDKHKYAQEAGLEVPSDYALAALRLLMFTGARLGEILQLRWSQVDRTRNVIRLTNHKTAEKTGAKELPINAAVAAILDDLAGRPERHLGGEWVIQGHKHGSHLVNLQKTWSRVRKAVGLASKGKANIADVRIHDLRHTFASVGVSEGLGLPLVGSLLGHTVPATTQRYSHLYDDPRLQASELIAAKIAAALG